MTSPQDGIATPSLKKRLIHGSLWMVAMRMAGRFIGLINTIVLARILLPADFGVVAMATLVVGLLEVLAAFGVDLALIKNQTAERRHYDTAWTFKIIQGFVVALGVLAATPFLITYFNEPRLYSLVLLLAAGVIVNGFENIGVVAFRKDLDFAKEFYFNVFKRVTTVAVTIACAVVFRNYWALAIGIVVGGVLNVIISYLMHPYRPRFSFAAAGEMWHFSKWMMFLSVATYGIFRIDEFIVGGLKDSAKMGVYNVAADIAQMPSNEIVMPVSRALFPGYAKLRSEPGRLASAFLNVFAAVALVAIPAALGLMAVAHDFVVVVLGNKWLEAIPVVEWLAVFAAGLAFGSITTNLLISLDKIKWVAVLSWSFLLLLVPAIGLAAVRFDIDGIAAARAMTFFIYIAALMLAVKKVLPVTLGQFFQRLWRPVVASLAMVLTIKTAHLGIELPLLTLLMDVGVGALAYSVVLLGLWTISGRPDTIEKTALEFVVKKLPLGR